MNEPELDATLEAAEEVSQEEIEEIEVEETEDEDEESEEPSGTAQDFSDLSIEDLVQQYNEKLADGVLTRIESLHQDNFCMLVMDLLSKMGYRVFQTARYTNEAEGSDLIQGIILENKPGMNPIYIQARKLSSSKTVSKADMLDFVNALSDKGGKGMFVTVGNFSKSAEDVARDEGIMLVDGKKLAGLMISNNFCVNTEKVFELKAIDLESFDEYEG
ncbi:MAG: restriction endonuclease [Synergistaceae bacterium]|nr:restriction endonuclease [Synergistaceae bacterium]